MKTPLSNSAGVVSGRGFPFYLIIFFQEFFANRSVPAAERTIQQSLENIRLNCAWLGRESEKISAWLKEKGYQKHVTRVKQTDVHSQYRLLVERESVQITRRKVLAQDDFFVRKSLHADVSSPFSFVTRRETAVICHLGGVGGILVMSRQNQADSLPVPPFWGGVMLTPPP